MDLKFSCTHCGQHLAIEESCTGRWVKCPACQKAARVPGQRTESLSRELAEEHVARKVDGQSMPARRAQVAASPLGALLSRYPFLRPILRLFIGWSIGLLVVILMSLGANLYVAARLPKDFEPMLTEAYRTGDIREQLAGNHSGSALLYSRNLERGEGVFIEDLATLKSQRLGLADGGDLINRKSFTLIGWSPDDRYLAFSVSVGNAKPNRRVVICDGGRGAEMNSFDLPDSLEQGAWLSAGSMVMLDHAHQLFVYNVKDNEGLGKLGKQGLVRLRQLDAEIPSFAICPVSEHAIAYSDLGNLWIWDLSGTTSQLTHFTNATQKWIDYDPGTDRFLFCSQGVRNEDAYVYLYDPKLDPRNAVARVSDNISFKPQWVEKGRGFAYIGTETNMNFLGIEADEESSRTNLFLGGHLRGYSVAPQGDKVYAVASRDAGPLSVWEYDLSAKRLRIVVPTKEPSANFHTIVPVTGVVTNHKRQRVDYYVLTPPGLVLGKKYPALIDQTTDSRYDPNTQLIANCGIFYASVNRYGLASSDKMKTALQDSMALYQELIKDPRIDTSRIYLSGRSIATGEVAQLVDSNAGLWRGIILLSPAGWPRLPFGTQKFPSVFMSIGDEDDLHLQADDENFAKRAYQNGVPVWVIYSHSGHNFRGTDLAKERYYGVIRFICAKF